MLFIRYTRVSLHNGKSKYTKAENPGYRCWLCISCLTRRRKKFKKRACAKTCPIAGSGKGYFSASLPSGNSAASPPPTHFMDNYQTLRVIHTSAPGLRKPPIFQTLIASGDLEPPVSPRVHSGLIPDPIVDTDVDRIDLRLQNIFCARQQEFED